MSRVSVGGPAGPGVRTLTTAGLAAVVGALVLGILGMHGLTQHGTATAHGTQQVNAVTVDPHAAHPAPDHRPVSTDSIAGTDAQAGKGAEGSAETAAAAGLAPSSGSDESASDMVMLCAAMVLAVAAGVLVARRFLRVAFRAPLSLVPTVRVPVFVATARGGTGPPPVWEFSVVRC